MDRMEFVRMVRMDKTEIHVTAALCLKNEKILIARRSAAGSSPLLWEFPGGKVEPGESARQALKRELMEELYLEAEIGAFAGESRVETGGRFIRMECFLVSLDEQVPHPREHEELRWVTPEEWSVYNWAPADIPLVGMGFP